MKISKIGLILATGMSLLVGAVISSKAPNAQSASAAFGDTFYDCVFDYNTAYSSESYTTDGSRVRGARWRRESDNPDKWAASGGTEVAYSELYSTNNTGMKITSKAGENFNVDPGTSELHITEDTANGDFVIAYIPFRLYIKNFPALSHNNYAEVHFYVDHQGWTSSNQSSLIIYNYSSPTQNHATFNCPKTPVYLVEQDMVGISANENEQTNLDIYRGTIPSTHSNTNESPAYVFVGDYGLSVYARKDKSSNHQLNISVKAKVTYNTNMAQWRATNGSNGYDNIVTAFNEAQSGDTIKIHSNLSVNQNASISVTKNVTLDLNGHTLTASTLSSSLFLVTNDTTNNTIGNLSIIDSSSSKTGTLATTGNLYKAIINVAKGSININGIKVDLSESSSTAKFLEMGNNIGSYTSFVANCTITSNSTNTTAIQLSGGVLDLSGNTFSGISDENATITQNGGSLYLSGVGAFTLKKSSRGSIYGCSSTNSSSYWGGLCLITLDYTPSLEEVIVNNAASASRFRITNVPAGYKQGYNKTLKTVSIVNNTATVTFNLTNLTVEGDSTITNGTAYVATLSAEDGYHLPKTIELTINNAQTGYYSYDSVTGKITITNKATITGAVVITAIALDDAGIVQYFIDSYMHMDSNTANQCRTYYSLAKANFNALTATQRHIFCTNATFDAAYRRLSAWATANGDEFGANEALSINETRNVVSTNYGLVAIISSITAISLVGLVLILKKKKEN